MRRGEMVDPSERRLPRVVIVGAGFAGLAAMKVLRRRPVEPVLIDRENFHTFYPLLYQVAAAELEPEEIAYPIRRTLWRSRNARYLLGTRPSR